MNLLPPRGAMRVVLTALPVALVAVLSSCSSGSSGSSTSTTQPTTTTVASTTASSATGVTPSTVAGGTVATGSVTCTNVTGTVTFVPPLSNTGTSPETTHISLAAAGCTTTGSNITAVTGGSATATIQSPDNSCVSLTTPKAVDVAVAWSPATVHASVASFSGYAVVTGPAQHTGFGLPDSKGSASVAGSFAGADSGAKSTAATYSDLTSTQVLTACGSAAGLQTLAIASGTVTFS